MALGTVQHLTLANAFGVRGRSTADISNAFGVRGSRINIKPGAQVPGSPRNNKVFRLPRHTFTHVAAHKLARAGSGQAQKPRSCVLEGYRRFTGNWLMRGRFPVGLPDRVLPERARRSLSPLFFHHVRLFRRTPTHLFAQVLASEQSSSIIICHLWSTLSA